MASAQDFTPQFIGYVRNDDVESAKKFLPTSHEIDLNKVIQTRQSSSGTELTPLMLACKRGHLKMMELLIEKGADVNFTTSSAGSALKLAVGDRKLDVVKLLVRHGAQVLDTTGSSWNSALTIACEQGDLDIVKVLLPKGPKSMNEAKWSHQMFTLCGPVTHCNYGNCSDVWSPVNIAANKGHLELLTWLLEGGAEVPAGCLQFAISERNISTIDMLELILKHRPTVNETETEVSALMMASCFGDIKIIKILLRQGAKVDHKNGNGYFALWIAAREGHTEVVKLLIDRRANVSLKVDRNRSILQGLVECYEMPKDKVAPIFRMLLKAGTGPNPEGTDDWHIILKAAIERRLTEVVEVLLQLKKDNLLIDKQNYTGEYPLMTAVKNSSVEIVKLLLEAGARTDLLDLNGKSPLMVTRNATIAKMLLERGVPIDQQDNDGYHALLNAMEWAKFPEDFEVVEFLLEKGADLDLAADDGTTARSFLYEKVGQAIKQFIRLN